MRRACSTPRTVVLQYFFARTILNNISDDKIAETRIMCQWVPPESHINAHKFLCAHKFDVFFMYVYATSVSQKYFFYVSINAHKKINVHKKMLHA